MKKYLFFLFAFLFLLPNVVLAHGAHGTGFMAGLSHPILGLDHLVAILGLGLMSYSLPPQSFWQPSLVFVIAMIVGGVLGIGATPFGLTEWIIVCSVLIIGMVMAFDRAIPFWSFGILAVCFGFFHGHAHGTEMPENSSQLLYILGFVVGAGLLSGIGVWLGRRLKNPLYIRMVGAFIAGLGSMMVLG